MKAMIQSWAGCTAFGLLIVLLFQAELHGQPYEIFSQVTPGLQKPNELITLDLGLNNAPDVYFFGVEVIYDRDVVEFIGAQTGSLMDGGLKVADVISTGRIGASVTRTDEDDIQGDGILMTVTFRVLSTAQTGESVISFENAELSDSNGDNIAMEELSDVMFETDSGIGDLNLLIPENSEINEGGVLSVTGSIYVNGVTDQLEDESANVQVWAGINPVDTDPALWDEESWSEMVFDSEGSEGYHIYTGAAGFLKEPGSYYIALRARFDGGQFRYGGRSGEGDGGFWDGEMNRSASLVIHPAPAFNYIIAEWNFNDESMKPSRSLFMNRMSEMKGVGVGIPGFAAGSSGRAASVSGWEGGDTGSKYWLISFSTESLKNITISSKQSGSGTGPRDFRLESSLDGESWQVLVSEITVDDNWSSASVEEEFLPVAYENQETVYLRWIVTSNVRINGDDVVSPQGTNRIDDIVIRGENISPEDLEVWPGDTNNDGMVDETDVLPLGIYWLQEGPVPAFSSIGWGQRKVRSWIPDIVTYADTDGDGIVNHRDLKVIGLNYDESRPEQSNRDRRSPLAEFRIDSLNAGEKIHLEIGAPEEITLNGISYRLSIQSSRLNSWTLTQIEPGDWGLDEDILSFQKKHASQLSYTGAFVIKGGIREKTVNELLKFEFHTSRSIKDPVDIILEKASYVDTEGDIKPVQEAVIASNVSKTGSDQIFLSQNYPNPFYPETVISYEIYSYVEVELDLYDVRGRHVSELAHLYQDPGDYSIVFDASELASGIYLCVLKTDREIDTRKMILIK